MLEVLDELAQVSQLVVLAIGVVLGEGDDGVRDGDLVVKTAFIAQHS